MKFISKTTSLIKSAEIKKSAKPALDRLKELKRHVKAKDYSSADSFIRLPFDSRIIEESRKMLDSKGVSELKYIFVVGIGGANLGSKAIYDAFLGHFETLEPTRSPKVIFMDTPDPEFFAKVAEFIKKEIKNPKEVLINIISKSGTTIEMIAAGSTLLKSLEDLFPKILDRLVVTTRRNSPLEEFCKKNSVSILYMPNGVGDRFSVFSPVGIFPLIASGIDVQEFTRGAKAITEICLKGNNSANPVLESAVTTYLNYKNGKNILDSFFFHPEHESLGKWVRQLLAESLGKEKESKDGFEKVGITPTVSVGSIDLHSIGQLYLGGPRDKFFNFIYGIGAKGPAFGGIFSDLASSLKGKSPKDVISAIFLGIKSSYKERGIPYAEIELSGITPYALGEFMQFKMIETVLIAELMGVNPYDQPNVESYKEKTRQILNR